MDCPLCQKNKLSPVSGNDKRCYFHCLNCFLIFADPKHRLESVEEKKRYATHKNSIDNEGYVNFLNQIINPTLPYVTQNMRGLDYGCGPGPTLSLILEKKGYSCEDYDPLFTDNKLNPPYDYIFATECFEHFFEPDKEIKKVSEILKPGGTLALMTEHWQTIDAFKDWYYTRDPTHVCFYHQNTFEFIQKEFGFEKVFGDGKRLRVLRKVEL